MYRKNELDYFLTEPDLQFFPGHEITVSLFFVLKFILKESLVQFNKSTV